MISLLNKNNKLNENKNSLMVTYPRTVNILLGNYPYPDIVHNFILDNKNNLDPKMKNYTNVKGGMTDWCHFLDLCLLVREEPERDCCQASFSIKLYGRRYDMHSYDQHA